MGHISSIGAGMYSDLSVGVATGASLNALNAAIAANNAASIESNFMALFDGAPGTEFVRIEDVREFPAMGTPPNIVNVPVFGQKTSQQIQGQADAPSMEITVNFVASAWASGSDLGDMVGDGLQRAFRFSLLNNNPANYNSIDTTGMGVGGVENSQYFFIGKIEALQVSPQLTDANTATITISVQSEFYGAYTND